MSSAGSVIPSILKPFSTAVALGKFSRPSMGFLSRMPLSIALSTTREKIRSTSEYACTIAK